MLFLWCVGRVGVVTPNCTRWSFEREKLEILKEILEILIKFERNFKSYNGNFEGVDGKI